MNNHTFIPCADNLHACLVGAWDEKERKRVAKKKKDHKGDAPFLEEVKPYDGKWKPLHFLTFQYLGFPAGQAHCLKILKLVPGSGPTKKRGKRSNV